MKHFDAHLPFLEGFHRWYMASNRALWLWLSHVRDLDIESIAPQHGAMLQGRRMVQRFLDWCTDLRSGVDLLEERAAS